MDVRKVVERDTLIPYLKLSIAPVNSDYFPFVDLNAGRARFKASTSQVFAEWMLPPLPVFEMLGNQPFNFDELTKVRQLPRSMQASKADFIFRRLTEDTPPASITDLSQRLTPTMHYLTKLMRNEMGSCD